jgi:hypothetical protein
MASRVKRVIEHVGFAVWVKRGKKFKRETHLFPGRHQAQEYAKKHFSYHPWRVMGVRVDFTRNEYPSLRDRRSEAR